MFKTAFFLMVCASFFIVGCVGHEHESIDASEFVNYGDFPLTHTVYVGSDTEHHYFVWSSRKSGGKWQIEKAQMPFRAEAPFGEIEAFLVKDDEGHWQPYGLEAPSSDL
jgi:hypothetical protein